MKIKTDKIPSIKQIIFIAEPNDKFYNSCMCGIVNLDLKYGTMYAYTDCGIFNYIGCKNEKGKNFLKIMKTVDVKKLLEKISSKKFDYELTASKILKYLFFHKDDESYLKAVSFFDSLNDRIEKYDDDWLVGIIENEKDFYNAIKKYDNENLLVDLNINEFISYDYPKEAKTFANLFIEYVQPKIGIKERNECMWYIGENTLYVDENGNVCNLKYGDEVKITPCEENNTEFDYFSYELKNLRTGKSVKILGSIEDMLSKYTTYEDDVDETDIFKKPIEEIDKNGNKNFHCPNYDEEVYIDDDTCDNCLQNLEWD